MRGFLFLLSEKPVIFIFYRKKAMTIDEILALDDFKKAVDILTKSSRGEHNREEYVKEYNGSRTRRAESVDNREDKEVDVFSETETTTNEDGEKEPKKIGTKILKVAKVHTNIPKRIVRIASAFLFGGEMNISFTEDSDGAQLFKEVFDDKLKMKSVFNKLARIVKVETKGAIIFYPRPGKDDEGNSAVEIRAKILSLKNGDFFPHFDEYGDMDAFTRTYKSVHSDGEERDFLWIQTATHEYLYVDISGDWKIVDKYPQPNLAEKITVVYAEQDEPEWEDSASSIDYYENRLSRLIDTNDYFGDPILKNYGESSLPSKNTVGKQISYPIKVDDESGKEYHGDAEYLVWQQSIDSIKLELESLRNEIYSGSSTPDLSFENMKSIGSLSGSAIELMFIEAFVKAAEGMEIFGPVVQRSASVVRALMLKVTNVEYKEDLKKAKPKITFSTVLPDDLKAIVDVLVKANGDKPINSQETITARSPFTKDAQKEIEQIRAEVAEESNRNQMIGLNID